MLPVSLVTKVHLEAVRFRETGLYDRTDRASLSRRSHWNSGRAPESTFLVSDVEDVDRLTDIRDPEQDHLSYTDNTLSLGRDERYCKAVEGPFPHIIGPKNTRYLLRDREPAIGGQSRSPALPGYTGCGFAEQLQIRAG